MGRFLLYFSYVGSRYCGLQRQVGPFNAKIGRTSDIVKTVLGTIESGLVKFRPLHDPKVVSSSRTDSGVHAICNTAHVDLKPSPGKSFKEYDPEVLCKGLNGYFQNNNESIRMLRILRVADNFHSRFMAKSRKYCYRLVFATNGRWLGRQAHSDVPLSIFDRRRVKVVCGDFDMEKVKQATEILSGTNNYRSFTSPAYFDEEHQNPVKTLKIEIKPSQLWLGDYNELAGDKLTCYDFIFTGNSFLYRMVRKLTTCLLSVGQGRLGLDELQDFLDDPENHWNDHRIHSSPPYGLYLLNVEYDKKDLIFNPDCPKLYLSLQDLRYHNALFSLTKTLEAYIEQNTESEIVKDTSILNSDVTEENRDLNAVKYLEHVKAMKQR